MFDIDGTEVGDALDFRGHGKIEARHPWPSATSVSAGHGVVFTRKNEDNYTTLFLEVYPPEGGFIRGEGETMEACEDAAWASYQRQLHCVDGKSHEWESRGYKNGAGFCAHCGTFKSEVFTAEELGQHCHTCGAPTTWSWAKVDGKMLFGCEAHTIERPTDQLGAFERLMREMAKEDSDE